MSKRKEYSIYKGEKERIDKLIDMEIEKKVRKVNDRKS